MFSTVAAAADKKPEQVLINAKSLKWAAAPPALRKGALVSVLYGDPSASGPYVLRLMLPSRYKIPFHWHSQAQSMTVISGALYVVNVETFDKKIAHAVKPGGFVYLPAQAQQFAFTKGTTVVEIQGVGPYDVNPYQPERRPAEWRKGKALLFSARV